MKVFRWRWNPHSVQFIALTQNEKFGNYTGLWNDVDCRNKNEFICEKIWNTFSKVEIFLEQRKVAFLSPSKMQPVFVLKLFLLYSRFFLLWSIPQDICVPWCSSSPSSSMHMSSHLPTSKSPLVKGIFVPRGRDKKYHLLFFCVWEHP